MPAKTPIVPSKQDPDRDYFEALGRFVYAFAKAELVLHLMFPAFARIKYDIAIAMKGSMRTGDLISLTKRVAGINKLSKGKQKEISTALDHLSDISQLRDRILHRSADLWADGETLFSSNSATMKSIEDLETTTFKVSDIENATSDLRRISIRLLSVITPHPVFDIFDGRELLSPWLYKQVKPETPNKPQKKKTSPAQSQKPRRAPSPRK